MHSTRLAFALALTLTHGVVASARAGTYSSPNLQAAGVGSALVCVISNVGTTPFNFTVPVLRNFSGSAVTPDSDSCSSYTGVLPAGDTCFVRKNAGIAARCAVDASSSKIRAVLWVQDSAGEVESTAALTKK